MLPVTFINIPELSPASDKFVDLERYRDSEWIMLSAMPKSFVERVVKRPKISRYRGALEAVIASQKANNPVIISHMPRLSSAVSSIAAYFKSKARHIAFSFNFTELPDGLLRKFMVSSFRNIDLFVVYSEYERGLYSDYFDIPPERIRCVLWTQNPPPVATRKLKIFDEPYLSAVGGEGRDFKCLIEAARASKVPLAIVARPNSLDGLTLPDNVKFFSNLPLDQTWSIAEQSLGVIVPLRDESTCCGQITIVSAKMLGIPLITNECPALKEYLGTDAVVLTCKVGDSVELGSKILELREQSNKLSANAKSLVDCNQRKHARAIWTHCIESCLDDLGFYA